MLSPPWSSGLVGVWYHRFMATATVKQLLELLENQPPERHVQFELAHDAIEGDLLDQAQLSTYATIDSLVILVGSSDVDYDI